MKMNKIIVCMPIIAVLTACGVSSSNGVVSRGANSDSVFGLTDAEKVSISGKSALDNVNDVVIGSFKVGFVESAKQVNKAKGSFMSSTMGGKAKGNVQLQGVPESTKKAITEAVYQGFISKLKAQGYNVVSRDKLTASSDYTNMSKEQYPYVADSSGFLSAYGKTVFYQPQSFGTDGIAFAGDFPKGDSAGGLLPGLTGIQSSLAVSADMKVASFAQENKLGVVSVTYVLDFAAAGGHAGISSASVVVGQNLAVTQGSVKIMSGGSSTFTDGLASITLGQPIESNKEFGEVINDTSDADVAIQEAANVASIFMGQGTNRSRDYIVKANAEKYQTYAKEVLMQANDSLLNTIKK